MKPVLNTAVAVVLLVMTATPAGSQAQDPTKDADYFPLKVNTIWTYEAADGMLITVKVTKQEKKDNHFRLETSINNMPPSSEVVAVLKEGICRVAVADKPVNPPLCFLKLPVKKGKWKIDSSVGDEKITGEFEVREEEVAADSIPYLKKKGEKDKKVKLVIVNGINLKINNQPMTLTYWFAPDVGIVKQAANLAGVQVEMSLKSLDLPK